MQRMKVVLPEPDAPMMQTTSRCVDLERDALEHLQSAEALVDVGRPHDDVAGPSRLTGRFARPRRIIGFHAGEQTLAERQRRRARCPPSRRSIPAG